MPSSRDVEQYLRAFIIRATRRASEAGYRVDFPTVPVLDAHLGAFGYRCYWCGGDFESIDHVVPVARGGLDLLDNLVPACTRCNSLKSDADPEGWQRLREQQTSCGTVRGFGWHRRGGEDPCPACERAYREYYRKAWRKYQRRCDRRFAEAWPELAPTTAHPEESWVIGERWTRAHQVRDGKRTCGRPIPATATVAPADFPRCAKCERIGQAA